MLSFEPQAKTKMAYLGKGRTRAPRSLSRMLVALLLCMSAGSCSLTQQRGINEAVGDTESTELELGIASCHRQPTVEVVETTTEVRLEARVTTSFMGSEDECSDSVTITLSEALGSRRLVDSSTGAAIPLHQ